MEDSLFGKILWRIIVPLLVAITAGLIVAYCSNGFNSQEENQIDTVENVEIISSTDKVVSANSSTPSVPIQNVTSSNEESTNSSSVPIQSVTSSIEESTNFFVKGWNNILSRYDDHPIFNIESKVLIYILTTLLLIFIWASFTICAGFLVVIISSFLELDLDDDDGGFWIILISCVLGLILLFYMMSTVNIQF